jgi:hypothetical protein
MGMLFSESGIPILAESGLPLFTAESAIALAQLQTGGAFPNGGSGTTATANITIANDGQSHYILAVTVAYGYTTTQTPSISVADGAGAYANLIPTTAKNDGNGHWAIVDYSMRAAAAGAHAVVSTINNVGVSGNSFGELVVFDLVGANIVLDTFSAASGTVGTPTTGATAAPASANEICFAAFSFETSTAQTMVEPVTGGLSYNNAYVSNGGTSFVVGSIDYMSPVNSAQNVNWGSFAGAVWSAVAVVLKAGPQAYTLSAAMVPYALTIEAASGGVSGLPANITLYAVPVTFDLTVAPSQDNFQLDAGMVPFGLTVNAAGLATGGTTFTQPIEWADGLDIYDFLNGSLLVAWGAFAPTPPTSYNVYVAVVPQAVQPTSGLLESGAATVAAATVPTTPLVYTLNQTVSGLQCTVSGLQHASYNASTQVVTPSLTYSIKIVPVIAGAEVGQILQRTVTPQPSSVELLTPMKRLWPFPNTGLD